MSAQTIAQLKALSLHGMAASFTEVAAQARHTEFNPESFMQQLIQTVNQPTGWCAPRLPDGGGAFPGTPGFGGI